MWGNYIIMLNIYFAIGLVMVLETTLTRGQLQEKLQCLHENLMSNNFRKMAILKKNELKIRARQQRIFPTNFGGHYRA